MNKERRKEMVILIFVITLRDLLASNVFNQFITTHTYSSIGIKCKLFYVCFIVFLH